MRLVIEWPSAWEVRTLSPNLTEIVIDPTLVIRMRAAIPLPAGITTWTDGELAADAPAGTVVRPTRATRQESVWGWPVSICGAELVDAAGTVVEERLGVFYRLLYNGAEVVVRGCDRARFAAEAPGLLERFLRAGVAWPSARASLYDLTQLEEA